MNYVNRFPLALSFHFAFDPSDRGCCRRAPRRILANVPGVKNRQDGQDRRHRQQQLHRRRIPQGRRLGQQPEIVLRSQRRASAQTAVAPVRRDREPAVQQTVFHVRPEQVETSRTRRVAGPPQMGGENLIPHVPFGWGENQL